MSINISNRRIIMTPALASGAGASFAAYTFQAAPASQDAPGSTTVTFNGVAIGTAASNRVVVVCLTSSLQVATGLTIGGITATKAVEEATVVSGLQIWYATVTSGTTANVVATFGANPTAVAIAVGNFNSGASTTPTGTASNQTPGGTSLSENLTIASGFAVVAMAAQNQTLTSWTNTTSSSGDSTTNAMDGGNPVNFYSSHSITAGSPTSISAGIGVSAGFHIVGASWEP